MPKVQKKAPAIQYAYDSDVGELIVYFPENNTYVYRNVSPYHVKEFKRLRNMGKAMAWLKEMGFEYYKIEKRASNPPSLTKTTVKVGETLYVIVGINQKEVDEEINKIRKKLVPDGHEMTLADGTAEYIEDIPLYDPRKIGTTKYTWDKSGNKIKNARYHVVVKDNKEISRNLIKYVFKAFI